MDHRLASQGLGEPYYKKKYHECDGDIEKSASRIIVCHHKACRAMANGDREGRIYFFPFLRNMKKL